MKRSSLEKERLLLQQTLDAAKTPEERNRLGQFATPTDLASEIIQFGLSLLDKKGGIRFMDPAFGTGSFFSALLDAVPLDFLEAATGYEIDTHYGIDASVLWNDTPLTLRLTDFTKAPPLLEERNRFNFLICNPPYVRHHHIEPEEKFRLQAMCKAYSGVSISGLAGLYCYFLCLSVAWMQEGGIAGWLIPSEFMDVNYGKSIKQFLLDQVTLLHIHRFDPNEVQFADALVSSAVVWFRNSLLPIGHQVSFSFGGSLGQPRVSRLVSLDSLRNESKWTRFPSSLSPKKKAAYTLSDLFTIKRGIATGDNRFFVLSPEAIRQHQLPSDCLRPILPSPRYIREDEIFADAQGWPLLERQLFLIDCRLTEAAIRENHPTLWTYLKKGIGTVSEGYLCKHRKVWYFQEERPAAPIACTYLGRSDAKNGRPFRFLLNHSTATAPNVYLLLYPKPWFKRLLVHHDHILRQVWQLLNQLPPESILDEGRIYGGGLHKLEPKELGNVDATSIFDLLPEVDGHDLVNQLPLFDFQI